MTDDQTGEVSNTAEVPAQEVPASESPEEAVDQQQPAETVNPESETGTNEVDDKPPKDNAAWAAMRAENKRLKEAINVDPEYIEKLRGAVGPQEVVPQRYEPVTGDTDYTVVTDRLNWTQQQALRANEQIARLQNQLELQQDRAAEEAFPELKTDKAFQQIVAEKKLAARVLGKDVTTTEIAREVSKLLSRREEQVVAQTAANTKQQIIEKQAATAEAKGQTSGGISSQDDESLRNRVRKGDMEAQTQVAKGLIADLEF